MHFPSVFMALLGAGLLGFSYAQTCGNGFPGVDRDDFCCPAACGTCGGKGCKDRADAAGLDKTDCCVQYIKTSCAVAGSAPCIINSECPSGTQVCNDPHILGLRGQHFVWTGVDGDWYALVKDEADDLQVNVRPTTPLSDFPDRQYVTGISVLAGDHSVVITVKDPYTAETEGCPHGVHPCLADGGLRITVDGAEIPALAGPVKDFQLADGLEISTSNLPLQCREFGGSRLWARSLREMNRGHRYLKSFSFEQWVTSFVHTVAPEWCEKFVEENDLFDVHSDQAIIRIVTPTAVVRFSAGINHRNAGKIDKHGRELPELDFWQTSAGVEGLDLKHVSLTGLLGETARPAYDEEGDEIFEGIELLPGSVEDYHVSGPLGMDFARLH